MVDVNARRSYPLVAVRVQVDEARHYQLAGGVVYAICRRYIEPSVDPGDLTRRDGQIELVVDTVGRIDDTATLYDPVVLTQVLSCFTSRSKLREER